MKNIVFIPSVKGTDPKRLAEVAYDLSILSWKKWAEKNNSEVVVLEDIMPWSYQKKIKQSMIKF